MKTKWKVLLAVVLAIALFASGWMVRNTTLTHKTLGYLDNFGVVLGSEQLQLTSIEARLTGIESQLKILTKH